MTIQDPRAIRTLWLVALTAASINAGMQLDTALQHGKATQSTLVALGLSVVVIAAFLYLFIREIWKRPS